MSLLFVMELPVVDRSSVSLWSHAYRDWPENRRISTRTNACVLLQIQVASAFCCCLYCTVIALVVVHVNMLRHTKHEQEMTALCWVRKFVCSVTIAPQPQSNKHAFTDIPSKHIYQMHWSKKCAVDWTYTCHLGDYFRINLGQLIVPIIIHHLFLTCAYTSWTCFIILYVLNSFLYYSHSIIYMCDSWFDLKFYAYCLNMNMIGMDLTKISVKINKTW